MAGRPSGRERPTLLLTALSAAPLISPSTYHRLTFRLQQKDDLVLVSNRLAIAGLGCLALSMTLAIMLITDMLFGGVAMAVIGALALAVFVALWYALPLSRWSQIRTGGPPPSGPLPGG
jgi:hypothetical protein